MDFIELFLYTGFVAGLIGYLGSQVGRWMGRRKHSLFGLRPKRSADLVAALLGSFVGLAALIILILARPTPASSV